jgi:Cation efflux family
LLQPSPLQHGYAHPAGRVRIGRRSTNFLKRWSIRSRRRLESRPRSARPRPRPSAARHRRGIWASLRGLVVSHHHDPVDQTDSAPEASRDGVRALKVSLGVLGVTAVFQAVIVWASRSVALLGHTLHNIADAATALPLWVAFTLGRRPATRRYTYGFAPSRLAFDRSNAGRASMRSFNLR